jgi:hypothetical protein
VAVSRARTAREDRLGLRQRRLKRPRIDREEQLSLLDVLPLGKMHRAQLTGDLRPHLNGRQRLDGPDGRDVHGDGFGLGFRGHDGHRPAAAAASTGASRPWRGATLRLARRLRRTALLFLPRTGDERQAKQRQNDCFWQMAWHSGRQKNGRVPERL